MRTIWMAFLCCVVVIALALPACADQNQDAVSVIRDFAAALAAGNLERAASLITQDSVLFMSSATSIAPAASLKEKPKPVFFDQELTEAEAQGFKGVLDAMILAGAVKIEPGQPVQTPDGIKVPVTVEIKRDIMVTKQGDKFVVDLAKPYPAALQTIKEMTQEGANAPEGASPQNPPASQQPGAETPGGSPGAESGATPSAGGAGASAPTPAPAPGAIVGGAIAPGMTPEAQEAANRATCLSNLKQLVLAMIMFAQDYEEHLPNADVWMDSLDPYVKSIKPLIHCPSDKAHQYSYAMNSQIASKSIGSFDDPVNTIAIFESNSGKKNAADPLTSLCKPPRHGNGNCFAYVDGHAKFVPAQ